MTTTEKTWRWRMDFVALPLVKMLKGIILVTGKWGYVIPFAIIGGLLSERARKRV